MRTFYNISTTDQEVLRRLKKGQSKKVIVQFLQQKHPIYTKNIILNHIANLELVVSKKKVKRLIKTPSEKPSEQRKKESNSKVSLTTKKQLTESLTSSPKVRK